MGTYKDPFEKDEELTEDEEKNLNDVDALESPEDVDKALEQLTVKTEDPSEPEGAGDETENTGEEEPTTENKTKDEPKKEEEVKAYEPPAQAPTEDKLLADKGLITIDDAYLDKADPKDKAILSALKGEVLSQKALSNYVNAQRLIGKKASELLQLKQQTNIKPLTEAPQPEISQPTQPDDVVNQMVLARLRKDFPDMPDDPAERKAWESTFNYEDPRGFRKYERMAEEMETEVKQDYQKVTYFRENYTDINKETITSEVSSITDWAKDLGLDLQKAGLDLTITDDFNPIINKLMFDDNGNPDNSVISFGQKGTLIEGIPVVNKGGLTAKFIRTYGKEILTYAKNSARSEGFKEAHTKGQEIPKTISSGETSKGAQITRKSKLTEEDLENINDPAKIDEILNNIEIK